MDNTASNPGVPWPAIDNLGRELPNPSDVGPPKPDRAVGIFYFLWLSAHDTGQGGPYDVARILAEYPDALQTPTSPPWGPEGHMHFWGESLNGYYVSHDPWVLRRHAHQLADAGIDTLIFDTTNRVTYRDTYMALCEVFTQVRAEGGRTPQIVFMVNTRAGETAQEIYNDLYKPGLYSDLWFQWEGKPLMICDPEKASEELRDFFTLRRAHWPFEQVNTPYAWHWEATYPQHYGYTDDPGKAEQVNVSVAQNLRASDGKVTNMSRRDARGRSFHDGKQNITDDSVNWGGNAAEQWEHAIEVDPPFVMVTGWNEWIAGRYKRDNEPVVFVDQFDQEFSRDIEMVKGLHGDNYYYQLIDNVRRYKGAPQLPKPSKAKTIEIDGDFAQWSDVGPDFTDPAGETIPRDEAGCSGLHYENRTGRNEFLTLKVARDKEFVSFYARTQDPITPSTDPNWMMLLIRTGAAGSPDWEGFDFAVNRVSPGATAVLERSTGGWNWEKVADIEFRVDGNEMHLAIPRKALGLAKGKDLNIDFKWLDNIEQPVDIMDVYANGDAAPAGRFRYRYTTD